MRKLILSLILFLLATSLFAQGVAINANSTAPAANAILDVSSSTKGVFIPRVTTAQRKAISVNSNDVGLLVFDKERNLLYMYDGTKWVPFATVAAETVTSSTSISEPQVSAMSRFGLAVAVDSIYAVVGSPSDSVSNKPAQGTAQVFKKQNGTWSQVAELTPADGVAHERFGSCVAIRGDYIIVGVPNYSLNANIVGSGAAYIFHRVGNNWVQVQKLMGDNPYTLQGFATSVAMSDSIIAIGMPGSSLVGALGSVYVYDLSYNIWSRDTILTATAGTSGDQLGRSVSISTAGNYIVAGAPDANNTALGLTNCGAAYVFANNHGHWFQHARIYEDFPNEYDHFGEKVNIYNTEIIISDGNNFGELFRKSGSNWLYIETFTNPTDNNGNFGDDVIIHENYMFISAPADQALGMSPAGAVYVYKRNAYGSLVFYKRIIDKDPFYGDEFGKSMSFDGFNLLIGAPASNSQYRKGKVLFSTVSD